jgi:hypothetical protein
MTDIDLGSLLAAAAADLRPATFVRREIPAGDSPAEQAAAGYVMAVNLVSRAAEMDCEDAWRDRQKIYAAEIARLHTAGGTADPAAALCTDLRHLPRIEVLKRVSTAVEEINALTQRLIDVDRPGGTVHEFLAARHLDTTVPPY